MEAAPVQLDEIVSTATGEQRKLEVANAVSTIDAAKIAEESPITEFGNLISGRAAGVQVLKSGGTTGTGTRIRIRGSNSISLSNEPLYYIDGIRMESNSSSLSLDVGGTIGGGATSAINDLNPDDIESIEIVKGPAAATLYGIQASNGVVKITTKRGTAGKPRWNFFTEGGAVHDNNTYPLNFFGRDTTTATGPDFDFFCYLENAVAGDCTQTSVEQYSPLENKATRPLKTGFRQQYGANVSGGSDQVTYYVGRGLRERGRRVPPAADRGGLHPPAPRERAGEPDPAQRPRAAQPPGQRQLDLEQELRPVGLDRIRLQRYPVGRERQQRAHHHGQRRDVHQPADGHRRLVLHARRSSSPSWPTQGVERFTGGLTYNLRPTSWLSTRATLGYDVVNRNDIQFFPTGQVAPLDQNNEGIRTENRFQVSQTSVDLAATGRFKLSAGAGLQDHRRRASSSGT